MKITNAMIMAIVIGIILFVLGYGLGLLDTRKKFWSGECWLNSQSRDIECIVLMLD